MGLELSTATSAQLASVRDNLGVYSYGIDPSSPPFNCTGNGSDDDTTNFQLAVARCRATGLPLILRPGKSYKLTSKVALDWDNPVVWGADSRVIFTAGTATGFELGATSGTSQKGLLYGFTVDGTGDFADNQKLIYCLDEKPKTYRLEALWLRYAKYGLYTQYCDYWDLKQLYFRGNETQWYGGHATNVTTASGLAFIGTSAGGTSVTDKHLWCDDVDSLTLIGSEFGDGNYGLYCPTSETGATSGITLIGHRDERVAVSNIVWGTGVGTYKPTHLSIQNSLFMMAVGEAARDIISIDRGTNAVLREVRGAVLGASHVLCKSNHSADTVIMENCTVNAGNIFENSVGGFTNTRAISNGW